MPLYSVEGYYNGDERVTNHLTMAEAVAEKYGIVFNHGVKPEDIYILEEV